MNYIMNFLGRMKIVKDLYFHVLLVWYHSYSDKRDMEKTLQFYKEKETNICFERMDKLL